MGAQRASAAPRHTCLGRVAALRARPSGPRRSACGLRERRVTWTRAARCLARVGPAAPGRTETASAIQAQTGTDRISGVRPHPVEGRRVRGRLREAVIDPRAGEVEVPDDLPAAGLVAPDDVVRVERRRGAAAVVAPGYHLPVGVAGVGRSDELAAEALHRRVHVPGDELAQGGAVPEGMLAGRRGRRSSAATISQLACAAWSGSGMMLPSLRPRPRGASRGAPEGLLTRGVYVQHKALREPNPKARGSLAAAAL